MIGAKVKIIKNIYNRGVTGRIVDVRNSPFSEAGYNVIYVVKYDVGQRGGYDNRYYQGTSQFYPCCVQFI